MTRNTRSAAANHRTTLRTAADGEGTHVPARRPDFGTAPARRPDALRRAARRARGRHPRHAPGARRPPATCARASRCCRTRRRPPPAAAPVEMVTIPDAPYDRGLWTDAEDEGLGSPLPARARSAAEPHRPGAALPLCHPRAPAKERGPRHRPSESPLATGTTPTTSPPAPQKARGVRAPGRAAISAPHLRTDRWWLPPLVTAPRPGRLRRLLDLAGLRERHYYAAPYVSPFYSPCLASNCTDMNGGADWHLFGSWWGLSPALLVLIFPLGFRLTCYYYRKAYYRALLGVAAGLRGRRAAREVHRRDPVPADPAERPPVLLLPGPPGGRHPHLRRGARASATSTAPGATRASAPWSCWSTSR